MTSGYAAVGREPNCLQGCVGRLDDLEREARGVGTESRVRIGTLTITGRRLP